MNSSSGFVTEKFIEMQRKQLVSTMETDKMTTEDFKDMLSKMRPLMCGNEHKEANVRVMSWLRFLASTNPPDHPLRNAVLLELYAQMSNDKLRGPFTKMAPGGLLRDVDWRECKTLAEYAARAKRAGSPGGIGNQGMVGLSDASWSDCETVVTATSAISVQQWRNDSAGMGDCRPCWNNDVVGSESPHESIAARSSVTTYFPPDTPSVAGVGDLPHAGVCSSCLQLPDKRSMVDSYEKQLRQLRDDLLQEKTLSFKSINMITEELREMTRKIEEMESDQHMHESRARDFVKKREQNVTQVVVLVSQRLNQIQQLSGDFNERLRRVTDSLEELQHQQDEMAKSQSDFMHQCELIRESEIARQTEAIRNEFEGRLAKRDAHNASKVAVLKKTIKRFSDAKRLWAEEYERRIQYTELEKDFEMKRMQLQLQAERQELETVAWKYRQGDLQRIKQLEEKLKSLSTGIN